MGKVTECTFLAIFLIKLISVNGNLECSTLSDEPYSVTSKDFKINRKEVKSLFCSAYFCSATIQPIKLLLDNYVHIKRYSTLIYSGPHTISLSKDCSSCKASSISAKQENGTCEACPKLPESRNIEIHIRIDKPTEANSHGDSCLFDEFFNITIFSRNKVDRKAVYCRDGHNISLAADMEACIIGNNSDLQQTCIKPSCSSGVISESIATGNILHQFPPSKTKEACIFHIKSDFKPVEIFYSPNIKESLIVYGSTLDIPKWNLASCDDSYSKIMINPTGNSFYIVYKNEGELHTKGSLSIVTVSENLCDTPPLVQNGRAQVIHEGLKKVLQFECDEGFVIIGRKEVACDNVLFEHIPTCAIIEQAERLPDEATFASAKVPIANPIPLAYEGNKPPLVVHNERINAVRWEVTLPKKTIQADGSRQNVSNTTLLELDTVTTLSPVIISSPINTSYEGSGGIADDEPTGEDYVASDYDQTSLLNFTSSFNASADDPGNFDLRLFTFPSFEDNMIIFILIGVGFCLIIITTIVSAVVCRNNGSCRSNSGRKFDTFQNPIYEKPIQVPITSENGELCHDKIDLGDLSDCTILE